MAIAPATRLATAFAAVLVATAAAGYAAYALDTTILSGTFPHAAAWRDALPLSAVASLLLIAVAAVLRRSGWTCGAGGVLAWALGVSAVCELPSHATNFQLGDTPALWPWLLAIATLLGLFTVAAPRRLEPPARLACLAVFAATSNGKLFSRDDQAVFALLAGAVLLLMLELPRNRLRVLGRGGRLTVGVGLSFALWVVVAALLGDGVGQGLRVAGRVVVGAALALSLALTLDEAGRRATARALLVGVAASLLILAVGYVDTARVTGWTALLDSRLRLFDMHPNGIGPLFALGGTLGLGFALARGSTLVTRGACLAIAALSTAALLGTDSRASLVGALAGAATFLAAWRLRAPRDGRPWYVAALALLAIGGTVWVTPLGDGLRARLDALAQAPSALGQRYHFWRMALAALERSPWFGVGPNQYHVHARYAEPSFYDGTSQTLHTHNLALGIAEGAGWPALLLYGVLLLALFEGARRTLRLLDERGDRAVPAGILAGVVALLASNLLDLGQSQGTFVPTLGWIALGWFGSAAVRDHRGHPAPIFVVGPLVAIGLALAVAQPLAGAALRDRSIALFERGRPEESLAVQRRAVTVDPGDTRGLPATARMASRLGWHEIALELRERRRDSAPGRANAHLSLARELLSLGRHGAAARSLTTARELDPRGDLRAEFEVIAAGLALAAGDRDRALEALVTCCQLQGKPWDRMPTIEHPTEDRVRPGRAFASADGATVVSVAEVVGRVAERALAQVESDPVAARRELFSAVHGYRFDGQPVRGQEVLRDYAERLGVTMMPSLVVLEADVLISAGRPEEALAAVTDVPSADVKAMLLRRARALFELGRLDEAATAAERAHDAREGNDLFFDAGAYASLEHLRLQIFRQLGRWDDAAAALRSLLRDTRDADDRLEAASEHWRKVLDASPGREALLDAIEILGPALGGKLEAPDRSTAMDARARRALKAAGGDRAEFARLAAERLDGGGLAAEELRAAFERLARP